jgi:hypothetical protein
MDLIWLATPKIDAEHTIVGGEMSRETQDYVVAWCQWVGYVHQRPAEPGPVAQPQSRSLEVDSALQTNAQRLAVDGERNLRCAVVRRWP